MLHEFVTSNRTELINRCRAKVAKRSPPGLADDTHGAPLFLLQLVNTLCCEELTTNRRAPEPEKTPAPTEIGRAAAIHGAELQRSGYSIDQVVHDYGDICQAVTELAAEQNAPVTIAEFHTLNRCLDNAIADAVTAFASGDDGSSISGEAASERRRLVNVAMHTFSAIQSGHVALTGATATLHATTLFALRKLLDSSPPEISPASGTSTLPLH